MTDVDSVIANKLQLDWEPVIDKDGDTVINSESVRTMPYFPLILDTGHLLICCNHSKIKQIGHSIAIEYCFRTMQAKLQ